MVPSWGGARNTSCTEDEQKAVWARAFASAAMDAMAAGVTNSGSKQNPARLHTSRSTIRVTWWCCAGGYYLNDRASTTIGLSGALLVRTTSKAGGRVSSSTTTRVK